MQTIKPRREQYWHAAIVLAAILVIPLAMVPLVFLQAKQRADGEASVTAVAIQRQVDNMLQVVAANADKATAMLGKPCQDVIGELTRTSTLGTYLRSLVLVRHDKLYCSPVLGKLDDIPLKLAFDAMPSLPTGLEITPNANTSLVQDRPAVIVSRGVGDGSGVLAVIDGQYLLDIQAAASYNRQFLVQILLSDSQRQLPSGAPIQTSTGPSYRNSMGVAKSAVFPIEVRVAVDPALISAYRRELWRHYAPFLVLAALLSGYLAHLFCKRRLSLVTEIYRGMRQREFHMVYQPIVRLATGEFSGVEALVRWQRPNRGHIRPDLFIPLAEDNGLIGDLTRHIFDLVAADISRLGLGSQDHIGVNISGSHLATPEFIDDVLRLMRKLGPNGPCLVLEVTEREALPDDEQVQRNIEHLHTLGVHWALDDFGTGQSALSYLEQIDADYLKIDRSFVKGIDTGSVNAIVLETIIRLGQRLQLDLIAEGIETQEQVTYLRQHGVQWGQGYWFAPPLQVAELVAWRRARTPHAEPSIRHVRRNGDEFEAKGTLWFPLKMAAW
ncbi:EAL domain-containing protein [Cupriavidus sp. 8B]